MAWQSLIYIRWAFSEYERNWCTMINVKIINCMCTLNVYRSIIVIATLNSAPLNFVRLVYCFYFCCGWVGWLAVIFFLLYLLLNLLAKRDVLGHFFAIFSHSLEIYCAIGCDVLYSLCWPLGAQPAHCRRTKFHFVTVWLCIVVNWASACAYVQPGP